MVVVLAMRYSCYCGILAMRYAGLHGTSVKMCVCELAYVLDISQPSVSKHIKKMMNAGLIEREQDGFWTNYFIKPDNLYAKKLLQVLGGWLNNDDMVNVDFKKAQKANREKLCCKK